MRIAIFTDTYEPQVNGVVTSINSFANELRKKGDEVYIFCPKDNKLRKSKYIIPFKSIPFIAYPEYRIGVPSLKLRKKIKKIKPDIIHVHSPATIGLMGMRAAKRFRIPLVMTYHTLLNAYLQYLPGGRVSVIRKLDDKAVTKYVRLFFNRAHVVIAPSNETKNDLLKRGVTSPIHIIPTGIKYKRVKKKKQNSKPMLLHVGRLCRERSVDVVIKAFKELLEKVDAELVITSKGPYEKELKELVAKLKLEDKVVFTGYVSDKELEDLYYKADVFVTASTTDTQGLVVFEAMLEGTPVVVPNAGGIKDYVINGKNGLVFKPNNIRDLVDKIKVVLKSKKIRKRIIKGGFKTAKELSVQNCTNKLRNLYKKFLTEEKVSIIIPTYMEENYIGDTLKSVKNQDYKNFEIIVVDSNSSDKTVRISRKYANKVIVTKSRGVSKARNIGAKLAKGRLLIFLDADTKLKKNFIRDVVDIFENRNISGLTPKIITPDSKSQVLYTIQNIGVRVFSLIGMPFLPATCVVFTKEFFNKTDGFPENLITSEDILFTYKNRKYGKMIYTNDFSVTTSDRRFRGGRINTLIFWIKNVAKTVLGNPSNRYAAVR